VITRPGHDDSSTVLHRARTCRGHSRVCERGECARVSENPPSRGMSYPSLASRLSANRRHPNRTRPSDLVEAALTLSALGEEPRFASIAFCFVLFCDCCVIGTDGCPLHCSWCLRGLCSSLHLYEQRCITTTKATSPSVWTQPARNNHRHINSRTGKACQAWSHPFIV
jgi:hypothetical protein